MAAAVGACGWRNEGESSADATVCRAVDGEVAVDEQLSPDTPSGPFVVEPDVAVWVGLIADSDFSESALFSTVTGLFLIDKTAPVEYSRDGAGGVVTDAPYLDFDHEGQFVRLDVGPGEYRLWSVKAPRVQVIRCKTSAD